MTADQLIAKCREINPTFTHRRIPQPDRKAGGVLLESRCTIDGVPFELLTILDADQLTMLVEAEEVQLKACLEQLRNL